MYVEIKKIANQGLKAVSYRNLSLWDSADRQALVTQCMQGAKAASDRGMDQYLGNRKLALTDLMSS